MEKIKWSKFRDLRKIDGEWKKVIVNIVGDIIDNPNPTVDELKELKSYPGTSWDNIKKLPEKKQYLSEFIKYFHFKKGRVPKQLDFNKNLKYPNYSIYKKQELFGSWNNAIRSAGLFPICERTDEELLKCLIQFYEKNGRSPSETDFKNNSKYPSYGTYINRFGSWENSLKIVGLDTDSMVRYGIVKTNRQKGRLGEIFVIDSFEQIGTDIAGRNCNGPYDGICPHGYNYDVKTSGLHTDLHTDYWDFNFKNIYIDQIEWFYLIAFDKDYRKIIYTWRIPLSDFIEYMGRHINIGLNYCRYMKKYDVTSKIIPIYEKYKNRKTCTNEDIIAGANRKLHIYIENKSPTQYITKEYDIL